VGQSIAGIASRHAVLPAGTSPGAGAAVSVLLLAISFVTLLGIGAVRRYATRRDA